MAASLDFSLGGRTAVVTGGGRGLGLSIAGALADRGYHVVVTHRPLGGGAAAGVQAIAERGGTADSLPLDLADASSFPAFRDALEQRLEGGRAPHVRAACRHSPLPPRPATAGGP